MSDFIKEKCLGYKPRQTSIIVVRSLCKSLLLSKEALMHIAECQYPQVGDRLQWPVLRLMAFVCLLIVF